MKIKKYIWGIIVSGLLMPFVVSNIVLIIFDPKFSFDISIFPEYLLLGILNTIPFIALSLFVNSLKNNLKLKNAPQSFIHKIGVVTALILSVSIIFIINIDIWISVAFHLPGSSTSSIAYFIFPFLMLIIIPINYLIGRILAKMVLRRRGSRNTVNKQS